MSSWLSLRQLITELHLVVKLQGQGKLNWSLEKTLVADTFSDYGAMGGASRGAGPLMSGGFWVGGAFPGVFE